MADFEKLRNSVSKLSEARVVRYGDTPQSVGWSSREQQHLRFQMVARHISLNDGQSILDLGSGTCDLYGYLKDVAYRDVEFSYTGVELSESMVSLAKNKYPSIKALVGDFWDKVSIEKSTYDYVVCSGALNYAFECDNNIFLQKFIEMYFPVAKEALVFNVISSNVDYQDPKLKYFDAESCVALLKKFSRFFIVDASYPLWEFTVVLFKDRLNSQQNEE